MSRALQLFLPTLLAALLLVTLPSGAATAQPLDYQLDSTEWNGLSKLQEVGVERGVTLQSASTLDYDALDVDRPLFILFPTQPLDVNSIQEFVADGGRVLLADDFGTSSALLASFSEPILRRDPTGAAENYLNGNPNLPVLRTPGRHALLDGGVDALVGNHPTAMVSSLPAVIYYDLPVEDERLGFAYDLTVGNGKMIAIADASIFINLMVDIADNRTFAANSLEYLCEDVPGECVVDVYTGSFDSSGSYGEAPTSNDPAATLEEGLEKLNEAVESFEEWIPERRLMRVMTLLLMLGLVLFGLTVYPFQPPRFLGIRFRPPARLLPRSEFERNLTEFGRDGAEDNYALPIAILRDEFERRLLPTLFDKAEMPDTEERYRPDNVADAALRYADAVADPDSSEWRSRQRQLTNLMKTLSRVPARSQIFMSPGSRWNARDLMNLYEESRDVLKALGVTEQHEQRI